MTTREQRRLYRQEPLTVAELVFGGGALFGGLLLGKIIAVAIGGLAFGLGLRKVVQYE